MKPVQLFLILLVLVVAACRGEQVSPSNTSETEAPPPQSTLTSSPLPSISTAVQTATQANYYVAPAGNDSNLGTIDEPWQTIQKAADTLKAGEVVAIRGGTYRERILPRNSG